MRIKESNLKLEQFNILASQIVTIPSKEKISKSILLNPQIDIDFDVLSNKNNKNKVRILLKLSSINEKSSAGYQFSLVCESFFSIRGISILEKEEQDRYVLFTAVPMVIAMARSHLYNVTANFSFGHYLLPSIDLEDLFSKKFPQKRR